MEDVDEDWCNCGCLSSHMGGCLIPTDRYPEAAKAAAEAEALEQMHRLCLVHGERLLSVNVNWHELSDGLMEAEFIAICQHEFGEC